MITLISNFYNEEYLLPHWLLHHRDLFDHAVLVNYDSTDSSVDIIKHYTPDWKIYQNKNRFFNETATSEQLMMIEKQFDGWKIILNTTEFIFCADFREYIKKLDNKNIQHICTKGIVLVDNPKKRGQLNDQPLLQQKHFGYFEETLNHRNRNSLNKNGKSRSRLLHCHEHGDYPGGRHCNKYTTEEDDDLLLIWTHYAPFNEALKKRKFQLRDQLSPEYLDKSNTNLQGWQNGYLCTMPWSEVSDVLDERYKLEVKISYDLLNDIRYKKIYEKLYT